MSRTKKRELPRHLTLGWTALLLMTALPALGVDGVLEINQACAQVGCFPGDSAGLPVTITVSGSYVLTSNLSSDGSTDVIDVMAVNASIDLNGFAIEGPVVCDILTATCAPAVVGTGIVSFPTNQAITLRNGTVSGMNVGITGTQGGGGLVEGIHAHDNARMGIEVFTSVVRGCTVFRNGDRGIQGSGSTVTDNTVFDNLDVGITNAGGVVTNNAVSTNLGFGISMGPTTGYGGNVLILNNGGNANPQVLGGFQLSTNLCGTAACP